MAVTNCLATMSKSKKIARQEVGRMAREVGNCQARVDKIARQVAIAKQVDKFAR